MKKHTYIIPETELCMLQLNDRVLEEYTVIDLSKSGKVSGGEINANDEDFWDDDELDLDGGKALWDE